MLSMNNDKDRMRYILIGILCTGFLCVIIALCLQLRGDAVGEEIAVDELLQQYWQEQQVAAIDEQVTDITASAPEINSGTESELDSSSVSVTEAADSLNEEKIESTIAVMAEDDAGKIDINRATAEQLQQLKGIGPSKAKAIIDDREHKGSFHSIEDIKRVKGIGEKLYAGIKESIVANP